MRMKRRIFIGILAAMLILMQVIPVSAFSDSQVVVTKNTKAVETKLFGIRGLKDYVSPETPAFRSSASRTYLTTVSARNKYVNKVCGKRSYCRRYYLDKDQKIPIVFITKTSLSGCRTAAQAASRLKKSTRVNVLIQAGIHGDETGASEGALYFLQRFDSRKKSEYLGKMNIVLIPNANPTGKVSYGKVKNANRDNLYLAAPYTKMVHRIYNRLMPEVFIDCHEVRYKVGEEYRKKDAYSDLFISPAACCNMDPKLVSMSKTLAAAAKGQAKSCGLRISEYGGTANNTISRVYYALYGSCSVLLETTGCDIGKSHYARRAFSHYKGIDGMLKYIAENASDVKRASKKARTNIIRRGKTYSKSDRFVLKSGSKATGETFRQNMYSISTGKKVSVKTVKVYADLKKIRSRSLPTAYVISKRAAGADRAVRLLKANGIRYYSVKKGTKITTAKYSGTVTKAHVGEKSRRCFTKGAYVIPMNQPGGMVIAAMMEPDVGDTKGYQGSLVQSGVLKLSDINRYTGTKYR